MRQVGTEEWLTAKVPGSVYGDLLAAGKMEDPFWKDNEDAALALMEYDYEYESEFTCDKELLSAEEVVLHFDGLDTLADIYLNGEHIGYVDNMHRTWEYQVKALLKEEGNTLRIVFHSPNKYIAAAFEKAPTLGTEDAMPGFVHIRKAHCMFGWDWGAHLPDAGIWRPVSLLAVDTARFDSVLISQKHEDGIVTLSFDPELKFTQQSKEKATVLCMDKEMLQPHLIENCGLSMAVTVKDPQGNVVASADSLEEIKIEDPQLWWPNGFGEHPLYEVTVTLSDKEGNTLDTYTRKIGLRTMTMDQTPDKWGKRFALQVNGVNIFAMGADYIPEDHLLGRVTPEVTRKLLEKAVFANFNSIRVWGGGYYPDDWFFDQCDELGLVVWEDFMFACAVYDLTPEFEANIRAEFEDNIKRMRHHASLGLLCGNNEMEMFVKQRNWVSKDSEVRDYIIMYERILPEMMAKYAPQVFYWPASPSSGGSFDDPNDENRGDVHYWEVWHGNKPFSEYRKFYFRYASEFGFQSFPVRKTVEAFTDDERDMNIFSYVFEKHQRNGSANGKIMNYMQQTYPYPSDFDTVLYASQLLQADAIRYGVEHFRRNRTDDRCMGAIYWQFNDCWPVASWASVDYCGRLKALHYAAKRFFAPVLLSCEEEGMMGSGQELVRYPFGFPKSIKLNVSNETLTEKTMKVCWQLRNAKAEVLRAEETTVTVPALTAVWLDKVELPDVKIYEEYVSYQAYEEGSAEPVSEGTVIFSFPKYFRYEKPSFQVEVEGNKIKITTDCYAKSVEILNENQDIILSDNYFDMNGGTKVVEILEGEPTNLTVKSVYDIR